MFQRRTFLSKITPYLHPIHHLKFKMSRIDHARTAYESSASQYEALCKNYKLKDDFHTWFSSCVLHIWMYNCRLRMEGESGNEMRQEIFNHLWLDVEIQLHKAGVKHNMGKIVTDLLDRYYGQTLAYDEGLYHNDMYLASAVWRNLYSPSSTTMQVKASEASLSQLDTPSSVYIQDAETLARLVTYVRQQLHRLETASGPDILDAKFKFEHE